MAVKTVPITPEMKVGEFLDAYPELEETLIKAAPPFAKLRSPVLRRTVARVTSLHQAAAVGGIDVGLLVNTLRRAAGQNEMTLNDTEREVTGKAVPDWFDPGKIWCTLDARPIIQAGEHPLDTVFRNLKEMPEDKIFELITPFIPAPMIDKAVKIGYVAWCREDEKELFKTYYHKKIDQD